MLENHPRNPLLILVFAAIGMLIRYLFFSLILVLTGNKPKKILDYSEGFYQIVYNILLTLVFIIILIFYLIYKNLLQKYLIN